MSDNHSCIIEKEEPSTAVPQVALHLSPDEADALLSILLQAANLPDVSGEMTERLLCRVADIQRQLARGGISSPNRLRTILRGTVPVSL